MSPSPTKPEERPFYKTTFINPIKVDAHKNVLPPLQKDAKSEEDMENPQEFEQIPDDPYSKVVEINNESTPIKPRIEETKQGGIFQSNQKLETREESQDCDMVYSEDALSDSNIKDLFLEQLLKYTKQKQVECNHIMV